MTKAATQLIGIFAIGVDFGIVLSGKVRTDSTAALGMVHREGLGRTRHVKVQYLWIQERIKGNEFKIDKVDTK